MSEAKISLYDAVGITEQEFDDAFDATEKMLSDDWVLSDIIEKLRGKHDPAALLAGMCIDYAVYQCGLCQDTSECCDDPYISFFVRLRDVMMQHKTEDWDDAERNALLQMMFYRVQSRDYSGVPNQTKRVRVLFREMFENFDISTFRW